MITYTPLVLTYEENPDQLKKKPSAKEIAPPKFLIEKTQTEVTTITLISSSSR
jgi:hypothetical protein